MMQRDISSDSTAAIGQRLALSFRRLTTARLLTVALAGLALCAVVTAIGWILSANAASPSSWRVDLPQAAGGVSVAVPVVVRSPGWLSRLDEVQLFQLSQEGEQAVPLIQPTAAGGPLARADGLPLLAPDQSYRLVVRGTAFGPGWPWPGTRTVTREVEFQTEPSPQPVLPQRPVSLRFGEPLELHWNLPIESIDFQLDPPARAHLAIDESDPRTARLQLEGYRDGTTYELKVVEAMARSGVALIRPFSLQFTTPAFPQATLESVSHAQLGEPLRLKWNTPIKHFSVLGPTGQPVRAQVDAEQPTVGYVWLDGLAQGKDYVIQVVAAEASNGAPLQEPQTLRFSTPPPLQVTETGPQDGQTDVSNTARPQITFSQPVDDRAAVERAFHVEPAVPGRFTWESPTTVVFEPEEPFAFESTVTVWLDRGPYSAMGRDGSYLEQDVRFSFTIEKRRVIDINLSSQSLALIEGDQVVFTTPVATGVPGAETPTGTYQVEYKLTSTRMRGVNPSGLRYDIPNVPWVLPFWGDYAIHGAPWRSVFGRVGSNGCVSMPTAAAKTVFDWSREGTAVEIHY